MKRRTFLASAAAAALAPSLPKPAAAVATGTTFTIPPNLDGAHVVIHHSVRTAAQANRIASRRIQVFAGQVFTVDRLGNIQWDEHE